MLYQRFDPSGCDFPKARVPMLPIFSRHTLGYGPASAQKTATAGAKLRFFSRARYALREAYRLCGVGPDGALMAPTYHCRTMLDPAISLGAQITLYPLHADLAPDLQALTTSLSACQQPVKALLLPHYFGFAQELEPIARFCDEHGITLIEDCSHSLWPGATGDTERGKVGTRGRFSVSSPSKFFPCADGGVLWTNQDAPAAWAQQREPDSAQEIKSFAHSLICACQHTASPDVGALNADLKALSSKLARVGSDLLTLDQRTSPAYNAVDEPNPGLAWSRWVVRHSNLARIASRRRAHYRQWVSAVAHLPHCRSLFPQLNNDSVPYVFPLCISHPQPHFYILKQLGIPVGRWDDMAISDCRTAANYRLQLLHLPCHQELSALQMTWMTAALKRAMLDFSPNHK